MTSLGKIHELRVCLQHPRRPHDTVYGKLLMRPLSIYFTAFFLKTGIAPLYVTLLSIVFGVAGGVLLAMGQWFWGLLLVNLWYLLDHTDGELARFYNQVSPTGLYFDTLSNAFVHPAAFLGLGAGLALEADFAVWFFVGLIAAYSSMMFLIIPFCEATVLLQWISEGRGNLARETPSDKSTRIQNLSFPKKVFAGIHYFTTFPVILPLITIGMASAFYASEEICMLVAQTFLSLYASAAVLTWFLIIWNQFVSRKIDTKLIPKA